MKIRVVYIYTRSIAPRYLPSLHPLLSFPTLNLDSKSWNWYRVPSIRQNFFLHHFCEKSWLTTCPRSKARYWILSGRRYKWHLAPTAGWHLSVHSDLKNLSLNLWGNISIPGPRNSTLHMNARTYLRRYSNFSKLLLFFGGKRERWFCRSKRPYSINSAKDFASARSC